jgi:hypothetical protein
MEEKPKNTGCGVFVIFMLIGFLAYADNTPDWKENLKAELKDINQAIHEKNERNISPQATPAQANNNISQDGWKTFYTANDSVRHKVNHTFKYPPYYVRNPPTGDYNLSFLTPINSNTVSFLTSYGFTLSRLDLIALLGESDEEATDNLTKLFMQGAGNDIEVIATKSISHLFNPGILLIATANYMAAGNPVFRSYEEAMSVVLIKNSAIITLSCGTGSTPNNIVSTIEFHKKYTSPVCGPFFQSLAF